MEYVDRPLQYKTIQIEQKTKRDEKYGVIYLGYIVLEAESIWITLQKSNNVSQCVCVTNSSIVMGTVIKDMIVERNNVQQHGTVWTTNLLQVVCIITQLCCADYSMNTEHLFNNGFVFLTVLYYTDIHSSQNMYSLYMRKNNNGIYL